MSAEATKPEPFVYDPDSKPRFEDVDFDKIRLDGGTQQRKLDPEAMAEYLERLDNGEEPPPVNFIKDSAGEFWPWDGFHRIHTAKKLDRKGVRGSIQKGTREDAIWLSYSANKDHGVRRDQGVIRKIIEKILKDGKLSRKSAKAIAEHVGTSQRYVEKVKQDMREAGRASDPPNSSEDSGGKVEVKRGGKTFEMDVSAMSKANRGPVTGKVPENAAEGNGAASGEGSNGAVESPKPEPLKEFDKTGAPLTDIEHQRVFARAGVLETLARSVAAVRDECNSLIDTHDPLFRFVFIKGMQGDFENLISNLRLAKPYALCPAHPDDAMAREGCKWCQGSGIVNKHNFDLAKQAQKVEEKEREKAAKQAAKGEGKGKSTAQRVADVENADDAANAAAQAAKDAGGEFFDTSTAQ